MLLKKTQHCEDTIFPLNLSKFELLREISGEFFVCLCLFLFFMKDAWGKSSVWKNKKTRVMKKGLPLILLAQYLDTLVVEKGSLRVNEEGRLGGSIG